MPAALSGSSSRCLILPVTRIAGGRPTIRNRSLAPRCTSVSSHRSSRDDSVCMPVRTTEKTGWFAVAILLLAAAVAAFVPAYPASRIDPLVARRHEEAASSRSAHGESHYSAGSASTSGILAIDGRRAVVVQKDHGVFVS